MKRVLFVFLVMPLLCLHANDIQVSQGENEVTLIESSDDHILIDFKISHFETLPVTIGDEIYHLLTLEKHCNVSEKGMPALPFLSRSFIIPGDKGVKIEVIGDKFIEVELAVAPSKGILFRDQDPALVPYVFSEVYNQNEDYPQQLTKTDEPYILRDLRGVNLKVYPFKYNPVKKIVKVYTHLLIRIVFTDEPSTNIQAGPVESINPWFKPVYKNHFMNFDEAKYPVVGESGRMLVICHPSFLGDIIPYVAWKIEKGIQADLVDASIVGVDTTSILAFIQGQFNLGNGLTFVQFVGDAAQIPTFTYAGGGSDPSYSLLAGSDSYPDIIVGRFSAETSAEVQTQVERTIHYERDLNWGGWLHEGTGIASEQGAGIGWNGLADWEHMDVLRTRLLNYNYTAIDQFYGTNGATATDVSNALNDGRGIVNYCGHGGTGGWATTGFSSAHVNALTNEYLLPYIHAVACVNGNFTGSTCFAESWLRATNGSDPTGAIAMYASSINQSWSPPMVAQDYSIQHLVDEDYFTLGALWFNGSCAMIDIKGQAGVDMFMTWHIFGDGSLRYRTNTPSIMAVYHDPGISSGQTTFFVGTDVVGAQVCLSCPGEIIASGITNVNGQVYLSLPSTINCSMLKLTVTAYNKITYQSEVPANADGIWSGAVSTDWHNSNNWMDSQVPDADQDVTIIAGRPRYPVVTGTAECRSLTIEPGGSLDVSGYKLTVNGALTVEGNLGISGSTSQLVVTGDVLWESGSTESITGASSIFEVRGHWHFNAGSDASIDYGFVKFTGAFSYSVYCHSATSHFRHVIIAKDAGKYILYNSSSTEDMHITGNLFVYAGSTLRQYSAGNLIVDGQFNCDGQHRFYDGAFVYNGPGVNYNPDPTSYFANFVMNSTGTFEVMTDADINGNLTINGGKLDLNGNTLTISGNWTNNLGTNAFSETGSRVIFDGPSNQTLGNNEDFGTIEVNITGGLLVISNKDVTCASYDWTAGGLDVTDGSFVAGDLIDSGLFGSFYLDAGGVIDLTNSDGWIDMNCNIDMTGGNFFVRGGTGSSWWPFAANATLNMSGGTLDFTDQSIYLNDNATFTLNENITGGTIRTAGSFTGPSNTFNPAGGIVELYGSWDVSLEHGPSSALHQVKISKSVSENTGNPPEKIIPHPGDNGGDGSLQPCDPKAGLVTAGTGLHIMDILRIESGSFDVNGKVISIDGDFYIKGHLIMDAAADVIIAGNNVDWENGSTATCTDGMIYFGNTWSFLSGSEALLSPGHLVITDNIGDKSLISQDDNSCFGDLAINNDFYVTRIGAQSNFPVFIDGNLTLYNDTEIEISWKQMIVNGNTLMNPTSNLTMINSGSILAYDSFTCDGTINMDGGDAYLMGSFLLDVNGSLIIDDGQFVLHAPYTGAYESITGYVELNGGTFQVTYSGIQFGSSSNFVYNGGNMKVGWAFRALYAGTFQPLHGAVEFMGTGSPTIEMEASNYFHDLLINKEGAGAMIMMTPLKVNNDLRILDGTLNTSAHDLSVMGDVIIELNGELNPDGGQIFVRSDWINNCGDTGFAESNSTVTFFDDNSCYIRTNEKFHNLYVDKDNPSFCILYLDSAVTVTVAENFSINDGKMSMSDNCTLHVMNDLYVNPGCEIWLFDYYTNCHITVDGVAGIGVNGKITLNTGDTIVFNSDFINQGTLDITDASCKVHGYFSSTSAASLILNSGEFIYD
ncbi:MAG: hypothetical protein JXA03_10765, partial [Bacteroidales bacterium]|nr:hypothetical protein [Bacteroidales bacterium]